MSTLGYHQVPFRGGVATREWNRLHLTIGENRIWSGPMEQVDDLVKHLDNMREIDAVVRIRAQQAVTLIAKHYNDDAPVTRPAEMTNERGGCFGIALAAIFVAGAGSVLGFAWVVIACWRAW